MARIRTFIAVDVSPAVRARAGDLINRLRVCGVQAHWSQPENMHLTLKFLGDTDETMIPEVCRRLARAAADLAAFRITLGGADAFPAADRPRTVWIGVQDGAARLVQLQAAVEQSLADLRIPRENRRYTPHLTVGRVRDSGSRLEELSQLISRHASFDAGSCEVEEVLLFASYRERSGPLYQVLGRAPLGGGSASPATSED